MQASRIAMTDGGIETVLLFHDGLELPDFAAFPLLYTAEGREALRRYYDSFLSVADERGLPFLLGTPTWRANRDWGERLGFSTQQLSKANTDGVAFVREIAAGWPGVAAIIDGILGPRGDGYSVGDRMTAIEAARYHSEQIASLVSAGVDRITALTMTYPEEAIGVIQAARELGIPVVPSFTVETDGRLPDTTPLGDAIDLVDEATDATALFFMVNCAHPTHLAAALDHPAVARRIGGYRANASKMSHAELDEAEELDEGDPTELGADTATLREKLPTLQVLGGCCGTDVRHVTEIVAAW